MTTQERLGVGAALAVAGMICAAMLVSMSTDRRRGHARPARGAEAGAKIQTLSTGEEIQLARHLVAGQRTVVEFTADW